MTHVGPRARRRPFDRTRGAWTWIRTMPREDRKGLALLAWFLLAGLLILASGLTVFCGLFATPGKYIALHHDTQLRAEGRTVSALVTDIRETRHVGDPDWTEYTPTVRTRIDGVTTSTRLDDDSADEAGVYRVGQRVQLMVDPAHPDEPRVRSDRIRTALVDDARTWTIVLVVGAAVFVPLLTAAIRWVRREDRRTEARRLERAAERIAERERERDQQRGT